MKILETDRLNYSSNGNHIIKDVSFAVEKGEVVSIIGPNGAGKTTLLRCIASYIKPSSGTVLFEGKNSGKIARKKLAKIIGYIPQKTVLSYPFTVEEFVAMGRYPYSNLFDIHDNEHDSAVNAAISEVKVDNLRYRSLPTLSGGELQKVLLASCLAQQPDIFLLDEVMSHLDPHFQIEIGAVLLKLKTKMNLTIVSVTHNINLAVLISDKVLILKDGQVVFFDNPSNLTKDILKDNFETDFYETNHPGTGKRIFMPCWEINHD